MRTDFVKDWVDALRSGEYEQGQQQLRMLEHVTARQTKVLHCCLGVACEIGIRHGVVERYGDEYVFIGEGADEEKTWNSATLPNGFWQWIGLDASDPRPDGDASLSRYNDELDSSF